jgi:PAS domain S-box-containing protein
MTKSNAGINNIKRKLPDTPKEIEALHEKVRELETTYDAIHSLEVDAIIVSKIDAQQINMLDGGDHPNPILVENIQEGVLTLTRGGIILYTNSRFAEMVNLPMNKLPGTSFFDYICPEQCIEIEDAMREISIRAYRGQVLIRHGPSSMPVQISLISLSQDKNATISVLITDRSFDQKRILFQAKMLDAVGDAVVALDTDQKIIYWNDAAMKTYGWKQKEVLGRNFVELIESKISEKEIEAIGKLLEKGEIWSGEYIVRHRDGHWFPIFANSSPVFDNNKNLIAVINASHDITERKLAEVSLKESEARYRHLVMHAPAAIYEISADGLQFLSVNETTCRILGYTQEELLEMKPFDILDKESQDRFRVRVKKQLSGEDIDESVAYKIMGRDGRMMWAILNIQLNNDGEGGCLVVAHDITERKVAEEKLRSANKLTSSILDSINGSFIALDKNWRFTYINQRSAIPDISPEDLIGKSIWETFPEIIGTPVETLYREVMASRKPKVYENKSRVAQGRYFELHVYPVGDSGLAIFGQDITERKDAEVALHQAQERTATILEGIADTFYSLDNQWRFTTVNLAAEKAPFGRPASELLGKVIWELYPAIVGTRIHQHYLDAAKNQSMEHYVAVSPLNGRWYEVFMQGREAGVDVYMRDVTDRKQAEEVLRESEEKYRGLFENVQESVAIYRMVYNENGEVVDRIFVDANPKALYEMGDLKREDVIGKSYSEIVSREFPKDRASIDNHLQNLAAVVQSGIPVSYETHFGDKHYLTTQYLVNKNLVASSSIEITERKNAETALHESESKYRELVENANSIIIRMDKEGKISFFNEYAQKFFGYSPDEILGQDVRIIVPPTESSGRRLEKMVNAVLKNPDDFAENENENVKKSGERAWILWRNKSLRDLDGNLIGNLAIGQDITGRKRVEEALLDNEKRLREADKLLEAVTEATKVIIAVEDTNFRYTYFNKPYASTIRSLTGKELIKGMSMIDVFSEQPEEQRSELNEWGRVMNGESVNQRIIFGNPSAGHTVYNVLHVPLHDESGTIIGAGEVAFDVTEKILVEETLRETSQYLTNLIDYANAPIIVWDRDFLITRFNHAFEYLTGRKVKNVIGQHLNILLPEVYQEEAMDLIRKTSVGERWESVEIPILHKNGTVMTVLWNSASIFGADGKTIVSTIAQGQDITERKKIESEYRTKASEYAKMNVALEEEILQRRSVDADLKKTLSLLNASLESTADGILVVDRDGRVTSYNQNFVTMWDIPKDIEKTLDNTKIITHFQLQIKDPDNFLINMNDLLIHQSRESYDMIELNDGRIFERYSKPQKIGKDVVGRVWSFRDITERKRSEENLVASLQEKEVLLREIHHRVKNNLQLITGLLDMTRMRTQDEATTGILTDMMLKIQTMAQIHTRLYESKQFGKIGLTSQFRDQVVALSNIYSHKGHEISCEIHAEEIFLPVDQAMPCALVINEILSNSYKHAFKGKKHGTIDVSAVQKNGHIRIMVKDDGIGFPPDFDISQTKSLGMKLVRTLVKHQLKGSLTINSHHGTEMIVEFPLQITRM